MFGTCLPGLGSFVRRQLDDLPGMVTTDSGFDGRVDVVLFEADRGQRLNAMTLRSTEDVFVEVGRAQRAQGDNPRAIAGRIWRRQEVERALSIWAEMAHPLTASMSFRVIARVLSEQAFLRTELRHRLDRAIREDRPKWRTADPARLEVWVSEYRAGSFVAGLRLTDARMRQHEGRDIERPGALRPTIAAVMVQLAGRPVGTLLDPCCGSGTILAEALAAGWAAAGSDIDPDAVEIARRNAPGAAVLVGDVRHLAAPDAAVGACVSNLPFGHQFQVQGDMKVWLRGALEEMARVTRPGGRVVLLAPDLARAVLPTTLQLERSYPVRLLGKRTTVWAHTRR